MSPEPATGSSAPRKGSAVAAAVDGYAETWKALVEEWGEYASGLSTRFGTPSYKADTATADLTAGVALAFKTWALLMWEAVDALSDIADLDKPFTVDSDDEFTTTLPGAKLELKDDLRNLFGDVLPKDVVEIQPRKLAADETQFSLCIVDASGYSPGLYDGTVVATVPGSTPDEVKVRLNV